MCFKKKENIARLFAEDTLGASVTLNRTWLHKKFSHLYLSDTSLTISSSSNLESGAIIGNGLL